MAPLLPGCGGSSIPEPYLPATIAWGRNAIREATETHGGKARAASVALLHEDRLVWQEAFGVASTSPATPATPETRFNVGSVSKVLAALAVMILVDRRQLELDTPVVRYLPQFQMLSPGYRDITVRHLLNHASGLPGTYLHNLFAFAPQPGYAAELEAALADMHLKHAPGAMAVYCNDGFTLIERVVAAVTGQAYPAFVQAAILNPLGMARSGYTLQPLPATSFARGAIGGADQRQEFVMGHATGGLCTTPGDMMKLAALLLQGGEVGGQRIVSKAGMAELASTQNPGLRHPLTPDWCPGLGWDSTRHPGLDAAGVLAWQKSGGTMFYASDFFVLPRARLALLLTGSAADFVPGPIAEGILLRALQEMGVLRTLPPPVSTAAPALATTSATAVQAVLGVYGRAAKPLKVTSPDGQRIDLHVWSAKAQEWEPLCHGLRLRSDGWWWSDAQPAAHYRWELSEGRRYLLSRERAPAGHYWTTAPLGQQMPPAPGPLPPEWTARLGSSWQVANEPADSIPLAMGAGTATLQELPDLPGYLFWDDSQFLLPLAPERAGMTVQVPLNAGRDLVELVVATRDQREWLHAAGWVYRRLG
jgi:CubicO group peptidase (beta-lactamase class C family)